MLVAGDEADGRDARDEITQEPEKRAVVRFGKRDEALDGAGPIIIRERFERFELAALRAGPASPATRFVVAHVDGGRRQASTGAHNFDADAALVHVRNAGALARGVPGSVREIDQLQDDAVAQDDEVRRSLTGAIAKPLHGALHGAAAGGMQDDGIDRRATARAEVRTRIPAEPRGPRRFGGERCATETRVECVERLEAENSVGR